MPGFSGVGLVTIYDRLPTGLPGVGTFIGNCPKLALQHSPNVVERQESMTVARGPNRRMTQSTGASIELVTDEFNKSNFVRATLGREDAVAANGTSTTYTFPVSTAAVGNVFKVGAQNVTVTAVKDSTGTPKTLPPASYKVDLFDGSITLLDTTTGGPYVQPFKADYTRGAVTVLSGLATAEKEVWVGMSGVNTDTGKQGVFEAYRVRFAVADVLEFINNDYQDYTLKGTVLSDPTRQITDVGGQYYKFTVPTDVT